MYTTIYTVAVIETQRPVYFTAIRVYGDNG